VPRVDLAPLAAPRAPGVHRRAVGLLVLVNLPLLVVVAVQAWTTQANEALAAQLRDGRVAAALVHPLTLPWSAGSAAAVGLLTAAAAVAGPVLAAVAASSGRALLAGRGTPVGRGYAPLLGILGVVTVLPWVAVVTVLPALATPAWPAHPGPGLALLLGQSVALALVVAAAHRLAPPEARTPASPRAGWYPDPLAGVAWRWWDGARWTSRLA